MAEQVSHNVVTNFESTSGSPLVDAAVNPNHTTSATNGTHQTHPATIGDGDTTSVGIHPSVEMINVPYSSSSVGAEAGSAPVEPSAGDAVAAPVIAHGTASAINAPISSETTDAHPQLANGTFDLLSNAEVLTEDAKTPEGSVDISLNSDTEGSRGDISEQKKDDKHHARTSSVKKPATFSKVSVTKNFLAKTATTAPAIAKTGDKPTAVGTITLPASVLKPRLIAKTGTSLRDLQKARLGTDSSVSPDASKVWNKNRPAPAPPQKQFTDEELKQQYGIHLATRLQTDENDKESKWADIDDDEDDWAPEAVVWMDGTKSTLTPQDVPIPQTKDPEPTTAPQPKPPTTTIQPVPTIHKPTELGPQKTILKPGANAAAAQQAKQNGGTTGTTSEKQMLKAKSPAPAPTRSPWATLPPVDKISPINPPVQQNQASSLPTPFVSQDARAYEPPPSSQPAREIAADTFDRSWREGEGGARELFNSTNGRYEPVPEGGRRGSIRPDRKPAVLQRPSQNNASPVEQTSNRSSNPTDPAWVRRRESSISQGSVPPGRRPSTSKVPDIASSGERRSSTVVGHDLRAPETDRAEPSQPMFAQQSAWQQQMPPRPDTDSEVVSPQEDPVKVQERVMREKRELARQRRQEEEEREEAEKKERLKALLAHLEGAGKSRKEREAEAAAVVSTPAHTTAEPTSQGSLVNEDQGDNMSPEKPPTEAAQPAQLIQSLRSTPSAPIAESAHSATQTSKTDEPEPFPIPTKQPSQESSELSGPAVEQSQSQPASSHLSPKANPRVPLQHQAAQPYRAHGSSYSSPNDRKQQTFGRSPLTNTDTFSPWPTTAPSGNVWGTSGIGNGTFDVANGFSTLPVSSSLPPPPGMGRPATSTRISPQSIPQDSRPTNLRQQPATEPSRPFVPPGLEPIPDSLPNQARVNGPSPAPGLGRQAHLPGPIAPPSRQQQQHHHQPQHRSSSPPISQRQDQLNPWTHGTQRLQYQYKMDMEAAGRARDERIAPETPQNSIRETFKQTSTAHGGLGAPRRYEKTEYTLHDGHGPKPAPPRSPSSSAAPSQSAPHFSSTTGMQKDMWKNAGESAGRLSEGLHKSLPTVQPPIGPPGPHHIASTIQRGITHAQSQPLAPLATTMYDSPPPPETSSHPVNSGSTSHPLVKLPPGSKPKVVVKLPPAPEISRLPSQYSGVTMPPRPTPNRGPPGAMQPIVANETWQARFNGLFNRTHVHTETPPSPPKTPPKAQGAALAVASSSRTMIEEMSANRSATVSLPHTKRHVSIEGFTIDDSNDPISKPSMEQMFNEELSFGSLPKIVIPQKVPYKSVLFNTSKVDMLKMGPTSRFDKATDVQTVVDLYTQEIHPKRRDGFFVHMPGRIAKLSKRLAKFHVGGPRRANHDQHESRATEGRPGKGRPTESSAAGGATEATAHGRPSGKTHLSKSASPVSTSIVTTKTVAGATPSKRSPNSARLSRGSGRRTQTTAPA